MKYFLFLLVVVWAASAFVGIMVHEVVHLALADEAWGVCIGFCPSYNQTANGWVIGSAYGQHNVLSMNEYLPNLFGISALLLFAWAGVKSIRGGRFDES